MKRRRMFDIEMPDDETAPDQTAPDQTAAGETAAGETAALAERLGAEPGFTAVNPLAPNPVASGAPRRGPMAAAVRETAASLGERRSAEAAIRAENDALAHAHVAAREAGLVLERVPLDRIDATRLERDRRVDGPDPELDELVESLRRIGLSNPIRLERKADADADGDTDGDGIAGGEGGRYELIQGWRRLQAFRALFAETKDPEWAAIPAAVTAREPEAELAYRRMVDENLIRKGVSYGEMAALARVYAADPETPVDDPVMAVSYLYASTTPAKRAHIRAFVEMLGVFGEALRWPEAIPRDLGLAVRRALTAGDFAAGDLVRAMEARPHRGPEEELSLLRAFARWSEREGAADARAGDGFTAVKRRGRPSVGRLRFAHPISRGRALVMATDGRVELRAEADFARMDRARLEAAVAAFFRMLDG